MPSNYNTTHFGSDVVAGNRDGSTGTRLGKDGVVELGGRGTVTQATSITTAVTLDKTSGTITTQAASAAAGAEHSFTVNNSQVGANDVVVANIASYAGTGLPILSVDRVAAGSFRLTITNLDASAALNAALTINFAVIKSVA